MAHLERTAAPVLAILVALTTSGCSATAPTPHGPQLSPTGQSASASAVDGPFTLVFEFPTATWQAGMPITGKATLSYAGPGGLVLWGSGAGVIGMSLSEVNGTRAIGVAFTADCAQHPISPNAPVVTGLVKSGGWSDTNPNAAFDRAFFADKEYRLPAGDWDLTAEAEFLVGQCALPDHTLKATVRLHIRS